MAHLHHIPKDEHRTERLVEVTTLEMIGSIQDRGEGGKGRPPPPLGL